MSTLVLAFGLVRALPASPAILLSRIILVCYLLFRADYRAEIRTNLRLVCGRSDRFFWVRNAWCVGRNLALMASVGTRLGNSIVDSAVVCSENSSDLLVERELHMVMASFHYGAWEFLPRVFARLGFSVRLAVGSQRDTRLNGLLGEARRARRVGIARGIREVVAGLRLPGVTGFMLDNTRQGRRRRVELDSCRVSMPDLPFRLAERMRKGVVPAFAFFRQGRLRVNVHRAGDGRQTAQALVEQVRARPEEWIFWGKAGAIEEAQ